MTLATARNEVTAAGPHERLALVCDEGSFQPLRSAVRSLRECACSLAARLGVRAAWATNSSSSSHHSRRTGASGGAQLSVAARDRPQMSHVGPARGLALASAAAAR